MLRFAELWAWGLPQAAFVLALAGAMGIATIVILNKRGPKNRLAREGPAYAWACLGTMPLGSAIAGLAVAPFLPIGSHPKGHCMRCGYDLAGLPAPTPAEAAVRCPECGYHPTAATPSRR